MNMRAEELRSHRLEESNLTNHLLNSWDFELLLMELRSNPVLMGMDKGAVIYMMDLIASA